MSAVFGMCTVKSVHTSEDNKIILDAFDDAYNETYHITASKELPIGTKLYWEFDCRTSKMSFAVMQ